MAKLSKTQKEVLARMKPGQLYSAYELKCSTATLVALAGKRKVICVNPGALGHLFSPQTVLKYRLAVSELEHQLAEAGLI